MQSPLSHKFSQLIIEILKNRYDDSVDIELATSPLFVGILIFALLFAGLLCWAIWVVFIRTPFYRMIGNRVVVPLPPEMDMAALMKQMAEEGYEVTTSKRYVATFRRRCQPDHGVGVLLVLVGLIPGLLYYLLASVGSLSSVAAAESLPRGETRVSIYSVDFIGVQDSVGVGTICPRGDSRGRRDTHGFSSRDWIRARLIAARIACERLRGPDEGPPSHKEKPSCWQRLSKAFTTQLRLIRSRGWAKIL